ncbi:MAG TPA: HyaD/HybD family hydrogenase maturation endopeptidase [Thermoanaerobaculia bacterium]|nr:HyaD/HybD family hydrogenase maturation endopeptidase [Thermoanaerobaculia bacterium]
MGKLLVLGLGNLLAADDGLGVAAVEELGRRYHAPEGVEVLDGGTLGLSLMHCFEGAEAVILVDAIRTEDPAGTLVRLRGEEVAPAARDRLSVHQIGVTDLLDGLAWLDRSPRRLTLLGLVPESLEWGVGCSPAVAGQLPRLVEEVVVEAARMGHRFVPRSQDRVATSDPAAQVSPAARVLRRPLGLPAE